jgi:hypothetical protein
VSGVNNGDNKGSGKFDKGPSKFSFGALPKNKPLSKPRRVRYLSDPVIEPYKTDGKTYYRYRHGDDPVIHLGTAGGILQAVLYLRQGKAARRRR